MRLAMHDKQTPPATVFDRIKDDRRLEATRAARRETWVQIDSETEWYSAKTCIACTKVGVRCVITLAARQLMKLMSPKMMIMTSSS